MPSNTVNKMKNNTQTRRPTLLLCISNLKDTHIYIFKYMNIYIYVCVCACACVCVDIDPLARNPSVNPFIPSVHVIPLLLLSVMSLRFKQKAGQEVTSKPRFKLLYLDALTLLESQTLHLTLVREPYLNPKECDPPLEST